MYNDQKYFLLEKVIGFPLNQQCIYCYISFIDVLDQQDELYLCYYASVCIVLGLQTLYF